MRNSAPGKNSANNSLRLSDYSAAPLYNIKAVVQATGILPSTLRAWERRYQMTQPQRSPSGYRLYSERDVAILRWLKDQVDSGLAISQAVGWLESRRLQGDELLPATLTQADVEASTNEESDPRATSLPVTSPAIGVSPQKGMAGVAPTSFARLRSELLTALLSYNEATADRVLQDAFAIYPVEAIGEELLRPVLVELGERWHRQELSVVKEHFASGFLRQRLVSLLRSAGPSPRKASGANTIWVGCAPGELHEGGALLLAIYLRRAGYIVRYLGQDLPLADLVTEAKRERPWLILLSASTANGAEALAETSHALVKEAPQSHVGFGGSIFAADPVHRERTAGIWLGESAAEAIAKIASLPKADPDVQQ